MADQVIWTDPSRAELARRRATRFVAPPDPAATLAALVKKEAPGWIKSAAKADANGKRLAKLAAAWRPGGKVDVEQLGIVIALLGGDDVQPASLAAYLLAEHGIEVALKAIVAAWPLRGDRAQWMIVAPADHMSIHDTSVSWGKRNVAECIAARVRADAKLAAQAAKAIAKVWPKAPRHARTAIAYAADDHERGAEIARELLANRKPHPFYPWEILPHFVRDAAVVAQLRKVVGDEAKVSLQMLDNLGAAAIPFVVKDLAAARDKWTRERVMAVAVNVKSIKVGRILAEYVGQQPYAPYVLDYFTRHRDLQAELVKDPELKYYADDLAAL